MPFNTASFSMANGWAILGGDGDTNENENKYKVFTKKNVLRGLKVVFALGFSITLFIMVFQTITFKSRYDHFQQVDLILFQKVNSILENQKLLLSTRTESVEKRKFSASGKYQIEPS